LRWAGLEEAEDCYELPELWPWPMRSPAWKPLRYATEFVATFELGEMPPNVAANTTGPGLVWWTPQSLPPASLLKFEDKHLTPTSAIKNYRRAQRFRVPELHTAVLWRAWKYLRIHRPDVVEPGPPGVVLAASTTARRTLDVLATREPAHLSNVAEVQEPVEGSRIPGRQFYRVTFNDGPQLSFQFDAEGPGGMLLEVGARLGLPLLRFTNALLEDSRQSIRGPGYSERPADELLRWWMFPRTLLRSMGRTDFKQGGKDLSAALRTLEKVIVVDPDGSELPLAQEFGRGRGAKLLAIHPMLQRCVVSPEGGAGSAWFAVTEAVLQVKGARGDDRTLLILANILNARHVKMRQSMGRKLPDELPMKLLQELRAEITLSNLGRSRTPAGPISGSQRAILQKRQTAQVQRLQDEGAIGDFHWRPGKSAADPVLVVAPGALTLEAWQKRKQPAVKFVPRTDVELRQFKREGGFRSFRQLAEWAGVSKRSIDNALQKGGRLPPTLHEALWLKRHEDDPGAP